MEGPKVTKVSILIEDKYLEELRQFVIDKGGSAESSK